MLQRITERMEQWPVEDWAANVGRTARRVRRRLARRRAKVAIAATFALVVVAVGGNALWSQAGTHPAPLWGQSDPERVALASHGGSGAAATADGDVRLAEDAEADDRQTISEVQEALAAGGWYGGPIDGVLDEATGSAIRDFEREMGMPETGVASGDLLMAITASASGPGPEAAGPGTAVAAADVARTAGTPAPRSEVVPGSVAEIQRLLNQRGFGPLTEDGQMGKRTRQALDQFAATVGLGERDGLSPEVLKALAGA